MTNSSEAGDWRRRIAGHAVSVEVEQHGEARGQSDPERGPAQRFAQAEGARLAVEYSEIQHQHEEHEGEEQDPEQEVGRSLHVRAFSVAYAFFSLTLQAAVRSMASRASASDA